MVSLWYLYGILMVFIWYLHRRQNEDTWDVVGKQEGKKNPYSEGSREKFIEYFKSYLQIIPRTIRPWQRAAFVWVIEPSDII